MENIMNKVKELYDLLNQELADVRRRKVELDARAEELRKGEEDMAVEYQKLFEDQKSVKKIKDVVALKESVAVQAAELDVAKKQLAKEKELFADEKLQRLKAINTLEQEAQGAKADVESIRAKAKAELVKIEERKKKIKEEVIAELRGNMGA